METHCSTEVALSRTGYSVKRSTLGGAGRACARSNEPSGSFIVKLLTTFGCFSCRAGLAGRLTASYDAVRSSAASDRGCVASISGSNAGSFSIGIRRGSSGSCSGGPGSGFVSSASGAGEKTGRVGTGWNLACGGTTGTSGPCGGCGKMRSTTEQPPSATLAIAERIAFRRGFETMGRGPAVSGLWMRCSPHPVIDRYVRNLLCNRQGLAFRWPKADAALQLAFSCCSLLRWHAIV